jgi:hypothetical protein
MDLLEKRQMLAVTPASDFTYTTTNGQVAITGYIGSSAVVEIPSAIDSLPVTSIGDNAFFNRTSLTGVTLPSGLKSIGYKAFDGCHGLTNITIPSGVTTIGAGAFNACSLTTVSIPASVTSLGDNPFAGCILLTSIGVSPDNTAYTSRDSVLYTKDGTILIACPGGRTGVFTIPAGVTSVAASSFWDCSRLTGITIPDTVTYLGYSAFWYCTGLTSMFMPDSVTSMNVGVFMLCENLTSVRLSRSLTELADGFVEGCRKLTDITIPAGVTVIGEGAFKDCSSLPSIVIPAGVTSIGWEAFKGCSSLTFVRMQASPPTLGPEVFDGVDPNQAIVYYPAGTNGWTDIFGGLPTRSYGVPGIPTAVSGIRGNGQVHLSWTAPVSDGGLPVKDYTIQYSTDGSSWQTFNDAVSAVTSVTVPGLTNGTNYLFRIGSVNDAGAGLYSTNSSVVTPATTPGTPTAVSGVRGNGQVQLFWTAPVSDGGLPVKDYAIQYSSNSGSSWQTFTDAASAATSVTVTGLTNGTGYLFRVASVNDVGTGLYAGTIGRITPSRVPLPPSNLVATRGNGVVRLSWNAPLATAGIPIGDYTIQYSTNGGVSWLTARDGASARPSAVISGLTIGRDYIFRVAAVGRLGSSDYSFPSGIVRLAAVPSSPLRLVAAAGIGRVVLSWSPPASSRGSAIMQYLVQFAPSGGRWVTATTVGANTTTATVSGLLANRPYSFRVFAVNEIGTGVSSAAVGTRTLSASPTLVRA